MKKRGFTLIELLVVVSIVSLMSSVVLSAVNAARVRARDSARLRDIATLRTAINLYVNDNSLNFPNYGASCLGLPTGQKCWNGYNLNAGGSGINGNSALNTALDPYISDFPRDPLPTRSVGDYYIYFQGAADIHCNGTDTVPNGNWLAWQPDTVSPMTDPLCAPGASACCSAIGCGSHRFCVLKLN